MKKGLSVLGILAVLTAVALPPCLGAEGVKVQPEGAEKGQKRKRPEGKREGNREGDPFSKSVAFGDDLGKVDSVVGLNDEQKKKLQDLKEQRDKALEKYDQTYQKRIAKAEAAMEKLHGKKDREAGQVRKDVEGFLKSVQTNRAKLAEGYERRMFAVLTPEQRAKWNSPILTEEMTSEFSLLFLEGKQEERLQALCEAQAKRLSIPLDREKHAKSLDPIKRLAFKTILTKKQQAEYLKLKAPTKTTGKGQEGKGRRKG